jgi:hypothetical protein
MGSFYVNFSVKRDDPQRMASALQRAGRKAVITPPLNGYVVVYEQEADTQKTSAIEQVGTLLSREAQAPVLAVLNHDDDVLCYWLYEEGRLIDSYNSCPDYFDELGGQADRGGDARRLCEALSAPSATDQVESILRGDEFVFAVERHEALVRALGLPDCAFGLGYRYIARGERPDGLDSDQLIHVD